MHFHGQENRRVELLAGTALRTLAIGSLLFAASSPAFAQDAAPAPEAAPAADAADAAQPVAEAAVDCVANPTDPSCAAIVCMP